MEKSSLRYISTIEDYSPVSEASRELANFKQNTHVPIYSVKDLSVCDKLGLQYCDDIRPTVLIS